MSEIRVSSIEPGDRMACATLAIRFAERAGACRRAATEIGLCVAELVSNVEKYASRGALRVRLVDEGRTLEVEVRDAGPGIFDVTVARQDGWSFGRHRHLGEPTSRRSLGIGLGAVDRLMDEVMFESRPGFGTRVVARKRLHRREAAGDRAGVTETGS
jgi:serine/threonine-protein kinase RsbT